jgi:hypothetical protein
MIIPIVYLMSFILTMIITYFGETKTKINPSRDKKEFENRMITVATSLTIFIAVDILILCILNS